MSHARFVLIIVTWVLNGLCLPAVASERPLTQPPFDGPQQITFVENQGQFHPDIRFVARLGRLTVLFHADGATYVSARDAAESESPYAIPYADEIDLLDPNYGPRNRKQISITKSHLVGARQQVSITGEHVGQSVEHYFLGNDPTRWRTDVPTYSSIRYRDVYEGIDLTYYTEGDHLKYDFIVKPGADPAQIEIRYDGIEDLTLTPTGVLRLRNSDGDIEEGKPRIFQETGSARVEVSGRYELRGTQSFGFRLDEAFDRTQTLVIDPLVTYGRFVGGTLEDWGYDVALDSNPLPNIYVVGHSWSVDLDTGLLDSVYQETKSGPVDAFVAKYDPTGSILQFTTYFGGAADEWGYAIAVDADEIIIAGTTSSPDMPTVAAYDDTLGEVFDGYVAKLSLDGANLMYATYLGGSDYDVINDMDLDASGNIYVTGMSYSTDYPTTSGAHQESNDGYWDAFVTKLSSDGASLAYSTYIGGDWIETAYGIVVDASNRAHITGWSGSEDYDVTGTALDPAMSAPHDVIVTQLSSDGAELLYSTFLGGSGRDYGKDIALDDVGYVYVTGWTHSGVFPVVSAYDSDLTGETDAFVAKISVSPPSLEYSTYLGGSERDAGYAIRVDDSSRACVIGRTESPDYPTAGDSVLAYGGMADAFFTIFRDSGNSLFYSTPYGGDLDDWGYGLEIDPLLVPVGYGAYVTGKTKSLSIPMSVPEANPNSGNHDAFLAYWLVSYIDDPLGIIDDIIPDTADTGMVVQMSGHGVHPTPGIGFIGYEWISHLDGFLSSDSAFSTDSLSPGTHRISFRAQDSAFGWSAPATDSVTILIQLNVAPIAFIDTIFPTVAALGEAVTFVGHGQDTPDDTVTGHFWTSSRDGLLSFDSAFVTTALTTGTHDIEYRVRDSSGEWSGPARAQVTITVPAEEKWEVSWWKPSFSGDDKLRMHDTYACTLIVTNLSQFDQQFDFGVARSYDQLTWDGDPTAATWDTAEAGPTSVIGDMTLPTYNYGTLLTESLAADETRRYAFRTRNEWNWIEPWGASEWLLLLLNFVKVPTPVTVGAAAATLALAIDSFNESPYSHRYTYTALGDAAPDSVQFDQRVYTRVEKVWAYWFSAVSGQLATVFTTVGYAAMAVLPPAGPLIPIAAACFITEAYYLGLSAAFYYQALDPDPVYDVLVDPVPPASLSVHSVHDSQSESCFKDMSYHALDMYSLSEAGLASYGKAVGAMQARSTKWSAMQLANAMAYSQSIGDLMEETAAMGRSVTATIPIPSASQVNDIQADLDANGLPQIEQDALTSMGIDYTGVAGHFSSQYDQTDFAEFYQSHEEFTANLIDALPSAIAEVAHVGVPGALVGQVVSAHSLNIPADTGRTCTLWVEIPGLGAAQLPQNFISLTVNEEAPGTLPVFWHLGPYETDGDTIPEIKIWFEPGSGVFGRRLQSIYGQLQVFDSTSLSATTVPFATAVVLDLKSGSPPNVGGVTLALGDYSDIDSVRVGLYLDSLATVPVDSTTSDANGEWLITPPAGDYYLKFTHPDYRDSVHGPVAVVANDTALFCQVLRPLFSCLIDVPGDVNVSGAVTSADIIYLVNFTFKGSTPPMPCPANGDVNCSGAVTSADIIYMVNFVFKGAAPPCDICNQSPIGGNCN